MTNYYPKTLAGISIAVDLIDAISTVSEEDGFVLDPITLSDPVSGELIGAINFDSDRHAYFSATESEDEDEEVYTLTPKGERIANLCSWGYTYADAVRAVETEDAVAEAENADGVYAEPKVA